MRRTVSAVVAAVAVVCAPSAGAALPRALVDRPDEWPAGTALVHVLYVVPSDGADRALDTNGTLEGSVDSFQRWLAGQSGGRALRPDTFQRSLDVTFHRLARTDAEIASNGAFVRDVLERDLRAAGLIAQRKLYAVYYDGTSTFACGGGAWPPTLPGQVAAMYLRGAPPGASACATTPFAVPGGTPGYLEFAMLHELVHTLGFVAACAPHHTLAGHVSDDPRDLMYAGPLAWQPSMLDVGRDDYFGHGAYCDDLGTSDFLEPLGATPPQARLALGPPAPTGQPRAGRRFGVTATVEGSAETATCAARVAGRGVPGARAQLSGSRVVCGFRVPPRTRGKRLVVSVTVRGTGLSATRSASFRVR